MEDPVLKAETARQEQQVELAANQNRNSRLGLLPGAEKIGMGYNIFKNVRSKHLIKWCEQETVYNRVYNLPDALSVEKVPAASSNGIVKYYDNSKELCVDRGISVGEPYTTGAFVLAREVENARTILNTPLRHKRRCRSRRKKA